MTLAFEHDRMAQLLFARNEDAEISAVRGRLDGLAILLSMESAIAREPWAQGAAMAIVACGARMFRGGVFLGSVPDVPDLIASGPGHPLQRTLRNLGARATGAPPSDAIRLHVGFGGEADLNVGVRGWTALVSPRPIERASLPSNPIAGVLAGSLAVSEAFRRRALGAADACRVGQSLNSWHPGARIDFDGGLHRLPQKAWLVGLGNLGQALLFLLSFLPFEDRGAVTLVLQDFDRSGPENLLTQLLTRHDWIGRRKARAAAAHMDALGFETFAVERLFAAGQGPTGEEPRIALVGVDNAGARQTVAAAGFDLAIDAGLGATPAEIFDVALNIFPGSGNPQRLWPDPPAPAEQTLPERYRRLVSDGIIDQCGAVTIAGQAVGVPSTALAAAALQLAQLSRALSQGDYCDTIDVRTARTADAAATMARYDGSSLAALIPSRF